MDFLSALVGKRAASKPRCYGRLLRKKYLLSLSVSDCLLPAALRSCSCRRRDGGSLSEAVVQRDDVVCLHHLCDSRLGENCEHFDCFLESVIRIHWNFCSLRFSHGPHVRGLPNRARPSPSSLVNLSPRDPAGAGCPAESRGQGVEARDSPLCARPCLSWPSGLRYRVWARAAALRAWAGRKSLLGSRRVARSRFASLWVWGGDGWALPGVRGRGSVAGRDPSCGT